MQPKLPTFYSNYLALLSTLRAEGEDCARKLGFRGKNIAQQLKDEIHDREKVKGLDLFEEIYERRGPIRGKKWDRIRGLRGIVVALDPLSDETWISDAADGPTGKTLCVTA